MFWMPGIPWQYTETPEKNYLQPPGMSKSQQLRKKFLSNKRERETIISKKKKKTAFLKGYWAHTHLTSITREHFSKESREMRKGEKRPHWILEFGNEGFEL